MENAQSKVVLKLTHVSSLTFFWGIVLLSPLLLCSISLSFCLVDIKLCLCWTFPGKHTGTDKKLSLSLENEVILVGNETFIFFYLYIVFCAKYSSSNGKAVICQSSASNLFHFLFPLDYNTIYMT